MNKPTLLLAAMALMLGACSPEHTPQPAAATPPDNGAAPSTTQPATATGQPPASESVNPGESTNRDEAALERVAPLAAAAQLPGGKWKAGINYRPIVPAQSTDSGPGRIEVIEVFWYACPHCFDLEAYIQSWLKKKPANVEFVRVPVMWGPVHRAHAHLFYTLQALQRSDLDQAVFETIHNDHNMLFANNEPETLNLQTQFAVAHGIKADAFRTAYNSFTVSSNLARAEELTARYSVQGVPLVVVNGKYETDVGKAGGPTELIALINDLVASEKRH